MGRTTLLALATAGFCALVPNIAAAYDHPYCLKGCNYSGAGECNYDSYAQCQAAASGIEAYCGPNLAASSVAELQPARRNALRKR
jgi:hypothetical protein